MRSIKNSLSIICLIIFPNSANATAHVVQALSGQTVTIGKYASFNWQCTQGPVPWINVTLKPTNGSVSTDLGPVKRGKGGYNLCEGKTTKGLHVQYTSSPGFHGVDHVQYRVDYFPQGNGYYEIDINVK